jgi:hypothetical protein
MTLMRSCSHTVYTPVLPAMTGTIGKMVSFAYLHTVSLLGWAGDQLAGWPSSTRVYARRERPHPGAQLTLFEAEEGGATACRSPTCPSAPPPLLAWLRQLALDGDLAEAEPKRCATTSSTAQISAAWPWASCARDRLGRISTLAHAP